MIARLAPILAVAGFAAATLGGCPLEDDSLDRQGSVDQLYVQVTPREAHAGETISFLVQGEPPARLQAQRFVDLLAADAEPLYRLTAATADGRIAPSVPHPLPAGYESPADVVRLQACQRTRLPTSLEPGTYRLQTAIQASNPGSDLAGFPEGSLEIVSGPPEPDEPTERNCEAGTFGPTG